MNGIEQHGRNTGIQVDPHLRAKTEDRWGFSERQGYAAVVENVRKPHEKVWVRVRNWPKVEILGRGKNTVPGISTCFYRVWAPGAFLYTGYSIEMLAIRKTKGLQKVNNKLEWCILHNCTSMYSVLVPVVVTCQFIASDDTGNDSW